MTQKKGFTLVEAIIATLIGALVLTCAFAVWSNSNRNISRTSVKLQLQAEANKISDVLSADIKAATAQSFPNSLKGEFTELEFDRFVEVKDDEKGTVKALDKTQHVTYTFDSAKHCLKRENRILSLNIEKMFIYRDSGLAEKENYRESKVDIEIHFLKKVPGFSDIEEKLVREFSTVIREDYFEKSNNGRLDIFALVAKNKEMGNVSGQNEKSAWIRDETGVIDKETLGMMSENQLQTLMNEQIDIIKDAKDQLDDLNKQVNDVDCNYHWLLFWKNTDEQKETKQYQKDLNAIKCGNELPYDGNGEIKKEELASSKCEAIVDKLSDSIDDQQQKYIDTAFGNDSIPDISEKIKEGDEEAVLLKQIFEMKMADRSMEEAIKKQNEEEAKKKEEAEKKGETYTPNEEELLHKSIDQYQNIVNNTNGAQDKIREEIETSMGFYNYDEKGNRTTKKTNISKEDQETANEMIQKEINEAKKIVSAYDKCNLDNIKDDDDYKAYQAQVQLKNLAETKRDVCLVKEAALTNINNIDEVAGEKGYNINRQSWASISAEGFFF